MSRNSVLFAAGAHRIIVGVDYGTTYSGLSFVTSNNTWEDIVIVSAWPGQRDKAWKTPTTIAYANENTKASLTRNQWGFEVTRSLKQYVWTKLLLDKEVDTAQYDDPLLQQMYGSGFLRLPPGKSAKEVAQDYLSELYQYLMLRLEQELGSAALVQAMPMECWITMPAIWGNKAQRDTKEAALAAGFGSRPGDKVNMITEPEAAALYALKPYLVPTALDPLKPGECVLICDCGGGTVDLVTYEILQTTPSLKLSEKCRGTGLKCGSTSIDRQFVQWMTKQFGQAYTKIDMRKRGPGSTFMKSFEGVKKNFGFKDVDKLHFEVGPLEMECVASPKYDDDEETVKIPRLDMVRFFEPAIKGLVVLIEGQLTQLKQLGKKLDRFILVGGFGDSPYLNQELKQWCGSKNIKRFSCPTDCQAAIVKGAALRGLEGIRPQAIIARRNYGWSWGEAFREGIDDEANAYTHKFDGRKMCKGKMHWAVLKNQELDESFSITKDVSHSSETAGLNCSTLELYSCPLDSPPEREEHFSVRREGVIETMWDPDNDKVESCWSARLRKTVYRFNYEMTVDFRSEDGLLNFKSMVNGVQVGKTNIKFDD
ncbi:Hsp70 family protein [Cladophialophora carrionii]|uniref:Hsp70 family protein n=1 Tax=Cladophialophora carrionii TaxID=86049 RepID=A0A1C1CGC2_9EURO|nr:Hsp70 family protein [Cladophialophora carrionii]